MVLRCLASIALAALTQFAFADVMKTCQLSGTITLTGASHILCLDDLNIAPGTVIETDSSLQIVSAQNIEYHNLTIKVTPNPRRLIPTEVQIFAQTAMGDLTIEDPQAEASISIKYLSTIRYKQTIHADASAHVCYELNGEETSLLSPDFKIPGI